ncbi:hypothetical protein HYQ46_006404 [Verticillium longisporum]|nr:hypothetical protein HYQ46_006404 [Verticillium longisporum]
MFCQTGEWIRHKDAGGRVSGGPAKSCIVSPKRFNHIETLLNRPTRPKVATMQYNHVRVYVARVPRCWTKGFT